MGTDNEKLFVHCLEKIFLSIPIVIACLADH